MTTLDFPSIHDQFRPRVLRYLTRLLGDSEADDVTQAVMLKVHRGLSGFHARSSVSTWIYRIATNAALDKLRQKPAQALSQIEFDPEDSELPPEMQTASAEQTAARDEMAACIRDFVTRLPENYRTAMLLSEMEGFKDDEIAEILQIGLHTAKMRLHRARERLRQDLKRGCNLYRDECDEIACDRKPAAP